MRYRIAKDHHDLTAEQVAALPLELRCCFYLMPWNNAAEFRTVKEWADELGWYAFRAEDAGDASQRAQQEANRLIAFVSGQVLFSLNTVRLEAAEREGRLREVLAFVWDRIEDNATAWEADHSERGWRATFEYEELDRIKQALAPVFLQTRPDEETQRGGEK